MDDYSMALEEMFAIGSVFSIFGITSAFILGVFIFIFAFYAALFIATRIPYYKMAKNAGIPNAWLIWIPIAEVYVLANLSRREFNIFNWIRTYDRTKVFWVYLISIPVMWVVDFIFILFMYIPIINIFVGILFNVLFFAYMIALYIINWRLYYDLLMTYGMKEHAMWASIVNCFCPVIMIVFSYMIMNKEPDYSI